MGCLIKTRSGIYYGVFTHKGKRVWRSTFSKDPGEAQKSYEVIAREFFVWKRLTLTAFRQEVLGLVEGKVSPLTLKLYAQAMRDFVRIVRDRPVKALTPYHAEMYMSSRLKEVSAVRVNIEFRALKALFNRGVVMEMIERSPFKGIKPVRLPQQRPYFLTREEFRKIVDVIDDPQFKSIVIIAVCTAMRVGELASLRWESIDLERGVIHLVNREDFRLKNLRMRDIPINQRARAIFTALPRSSEYIFTGRTGKPYAAHAISTYFKRYVRRAGLPEAIHFHTLRHTGASWLVQSNVPIAFVKDILGHSSITTTMIYAHHNTEHLRESLFRLDTILDN